MRSSFLLGLLVNFLAVSLSLAAVTWNKIGCDGVTFRGVSIDAIWDNARLMSQTAQTRIGRDTNGAIRPKSSKARVADNAHFMFGTGVKWLSSLSAADRNTLQEVSSVYNQAQGLLSRNAGYLFCEGRGLQYGAIGNYQSGVWYYPLPGNDAIVLRYTAGSGMLEPVNPCHDGTTIGQTFIGHRLSSDQSQILGVLLCTNQLSNRWRPTLSQDFPVSDNKGTPDDYRSVSGAVLHEMVHAIDTAKYQDKYQGDRVAYGFSNCMNLAMNNPRDALVNPDNYRIFAEMCMSPKTSWKPPG